MTVDLEDLKRRLVIRRKADGRSVYDEAAKSELVALCAQPGASVSRLARECGVNANQVTRWLREQGHGRRPRAGAIAARPVPAAFVAVPIPTASAACDSDTNAGMALQARLPNGVAIDLRGIHLCDVGEVLEALGRLRCSASTKG